MVHTARSGARAHQVYRTGRPHHDDTRDCLLRRLRWHPEGLVRIRRKSCLAIRYVAGVSDHKRRAAKGGSIGAAGPVVAGGTLFVPSGYVGVLDSMPGNVLLAFTIQPE